MGPSATGSVAGRAGRVGVATLLSRVLGAHDLGRLLFALALVQLIVPLSDFGFGRSALRRIAAP